MLKVFPALLVTGLISLGSAAKANEEGLAEVRQIFSRSFQSWLVYLAHADACSDARWDEGEIASVVEEAGPVFYPGWFDGSAQSAFEDELRSAASFARSKGGLQASKDGCFMEADLARNWRINVNDSLRVARGMSD